MKLATLTLLFITNIAASAQGVFLTEGQSYVFEFTSLNHSEPAGFIGTTFSAYFAPGTFTLNESVKVELFSNALTDSPFIFWSLSNVDSTNPSTLEATWLWWYNAPFWPDLQGMARITMFSGDAQLDGIFVEQISGDIAYSQYFPVPEPSPFSLFASGVGLIAFRVFRRRLPANKIAANPIPKSQSPTRKKSAA